MSVPEGVALQAALQSLELCVKECKNRCVCYILIQTILPKSSFATGPSDLSLETFI